MKDRTWKAFHLSQSSRPGFDHKPHMRSEKAVTKRQSVRMDTISCTMYHRQVSAATKENTAYPEREGPDSHKAEQLVKLVDI
jgi:hypothetical protein